MTIGFLSTGQAADYLNISVDTVNSRIRAGNFPPPDAIIGDRYQGWIRATIDRWHSEDTARIYCKPDEVADIINTTRRIAETIRSHGRVPNSHGIAATVPRDLYALTGLIESELRRLITVDNSCAKLFTDNETEVSEITPLTFDITVPPSHAVHPDLNLVMAEPTLRNAADELEALASRLTRDLISRPARNFAHTLIEQATVVRHYADEIASTEPHAPA